MIVKYSCDSSGGLHDDIKTARPWRTPIELSGPVGSGKTVMINRLQDQIAADKHIIVARGLSVDKPRVVLPALITALSWVSPMTQT